MSQTEPDNNGGEVTVRLPSETMPLVEGLFVVRNFDFRNMITFLQLHNYCIIVLYVVHYSLIVTLTVETIIQEVVIIKE